MILMFINGETKRPRKIPQRFCPGSLGWRLPCSVVSPPAGLTLPDRPGNARLGGFGWVVSA
jgi:hypothetical protein